MKNTIRTGYHNKLFEVARNTKNALIAEWKKSNEDIEKCYFKDKVLLNKKGLLPEGIGITSILLLVEAFGEESEVFSNEDRETVNMIVNTSLRTIKKMTEKGYLATPLISASKTGAFNAEYGYTDSVTWCLPSAILARYTSNSGKIQLDKDVKDYVLDAIADGIDVLCKSQKNGQWGFRTETECPRSLYFTYSAAAAIADFYDYILGEIALLKVDDNATEEEKSSAISDAKDKELINFINQKYAYNIEEKLEKARGDLQKWLIYDVLPLFPKIASCQKLDKDLIQDLGIWKHDAIKTSEGSEEKVFHHLYYTYYILDMMVTSGVDVRFAEMIDKNNPDSINNIRDLAKYYADHSRLDATDTAYYFCDNKIFRDDRTNADFHYDSLFDKTVDCALYAARAQYAIASKTANNFWNKAELPLWFQHNDTEVTTDLGIKTSGQFILNFRDPSIIAMALRANITYSYYVTKTPDIAVERLFDEMSDELFTDNYKSTITPSEDDDDYEEKMETINDCVVDLWDKNNYSIALTERSIEALVDFKDYLDKFYGEQPQLQQINSTPTAQPIVEQVKSPLDLAIESKIEEYLTSAAGQDIIANALEKLDMTSTASSGAINIESFTKLITLINKKGITTFNPDGNEYEKLMAELGKLVTSLTKHNIHKLLCDHNQDDNYCPPDQANNIHTSLYNLVCEMFVYNHQVRDDKNVLVNAYRYLLDEISQL